MYASLSKGDLIEMNNKKLSRLLEPNLKLYFLCMIVFAAATATVSLPLGLVEIACTVGLYAYFTNRNQKRQRIYRKKSKRNHTLGKCRTYSRSRSTSVRKYRR